MSNVNKTTHTQSYLKILVTSRPYPEIQRLLPKHRTIRLKTEDEGENINANITSFISHKVDELAELCDYNSDLKETVRAKLMARADGMFLSVSLIVQELLDTPVSLVSETLETTPDTVTGVYTHLLKRLTGKKVKIASKILTWVVMAPEPMTVNELAIACSIKITDVEESSIERALIAGFEHDIALCGPMLKVQHGVVHLVYQSAKDFLLHLGVQDCLGGFCIMSERVSLELAITCLTYLSFSDWDEYEARILDHTGDPRSSFSDVKHRSQLPFGREHDFYLFAAKYWPQFVNQTDEGDPNLWRAFFRLSKSSRRLELFFRRWAYITQDPAFLNALYISSYYGFCSISRNLLDSGADVNTQDGEHGTALQAAASNGDERVVLLLLDRGADINAKGQYTGNALHTAACYRHKRMVLLLLNRGADVNAHGGHYDNALKAAAIKGDKRVLLLSLDRGADVNAQRGEYGDALQAAAFNGDERVILLLLARGADVNARGGYFGNGLQAAAFNGHEQGFLVLLDRGADVNAHGGSYGNALQAAAKEDHERVVLLLFDRGANVNIQGDPIAIRYRRPKIVNLLLQNGATPN